MKKILVIGSLNLDMVTNVDHMPAVGETILCPSMQLIPGGKGANQAGAAASLGADTTILGAVGADSYAELLKESLCRAGADVSHLIVRSGSEYRRCPDHRQPGWGQQHCGGLWSQRRYPSGRY